MYRHDIHFTLAEATNLLPEIRNRVERIADLKQVLNKQDYDFGQHEYFGGRGPNGKKYHPPELEEMVSLIRELETIGIQMKDLELGLLDFPHVRRDAEEVYLCWKLGEPSIEFWHGIDDGYAGRREIETL